MSAVWERLAVWGARPLTRLDRYAVALALPSLLLAPALGGCALDRRTLYSADGSSTAGTTAAGGSSSSGSGSHSGAPTPMDLPVCSYSDGGMAPDCETIVPNPGFNGDIEGWVAEPLAITVDYDAADADDNPGSGSISVLNSMHGTNDGLAFGAGMECLPARAGEIFDMAGDIYIPEGQGAGCSGPCTDSTQLESYTGEAGLSLLFWPSADCSDLSPSQGNFQTNLVSYPGAWKHVQGAARAPDATLAMSVRALTVKPFKQFTFQALFDNVLLRKR